MSNIVQSFCFIGIVASLFWLLVIPFFNNKKKYDELPDDIPEQSQVKSMDFNGKTLYLSESDLLIWGKLTNKQKQEIHLKQIAAIKQGLLVKVTDENGNDGLITKREAFDKGILVRYIDKNGVTKIIRKEELEKLKR